MPRRKEKGAKLSTSVPLYKVFSQEKVKSYSSLGRARTRLLSIGYQTLDANRYKRARVQPALIYGCLC